MMAIADLDAECIRVREPRSRHYIQDAVRAYRAGAYRPAITATWVAVAFDLIQKYRELASQGEAEAVSYIAAWDSAVSGNQMPKLLELERGLLRHAYDHFSMFNSAGLRSLERLQQDRHTSAHPAFVSVDELYEPTDELARLHIFTAIDVVLGQRPIRGKGVLDAFGADILSPGFPVFVDASMNYVEQKYLAHMKPSAITNLGVVLAKSLVRNVPAEWAPHTAKVHRALYTIRQRRPDNWAAIISTFARLINDDDPELRSHALAAIGFFPELMEVIGGATLESLKAHSSNVEAMNAHPFSFSAVDVGIFTEIIRTTFWASSGEQQASVISVVTPHALWDLCLQLYRESHSFRGAESRYDSYIYPYVPLLQQQGIDEVFEAAAANGQIWHAGGTPTRLLAMLAELKAVPSSDAATSLYGATGGNNFGDYEKLWQHIEGAGWQRPDL